MGCVRYTKVKKCLNLQRLALAINSCMATVLFTATWSASVYAAEENTRHYVIEQGTLEEGLLSIARQSQQTISFDPKLVASYRARPISGNYTVQQAILQQLQDTPLSVNVTANGTLTIDKLTTAKPVAISDSQTVQDSGQMLPNITVNSTVDQNEDVSVYNPSMSNSATRTNLALQETAQSVQVVSRKLIDDRQATSVEDALRNAGGVTVDGGNRGQNSLNIRGFQISSGSTDGMSNPGSAVNGSATGYTNIDGIERVEVLKGPQAVLSGSGSPAGSVNIVRKAPTATPIRNLTTELANYGEIKGAIDLGGPLNDDKTLMYRLNASSMHANNSFPDFNGKHSDYLSPVLAYDNDEGTQFKIGAEFDSNRNSGPAATLYSNGRIQPLKVYRLGDKDNHFSVNSKTGYYELNQELDNNWSFISKATYLDNTTNYSLHETLDAASDGSLTTDPLANKTELQSWSLQNNIQGKFDTGPLTHNILLGYDYQHVSTTSWDLEDSPIFTNGNYNDPDSLVFPPIDKPTLRSYTLKQIQKGIILQNQLDLWKNWHLQLAVKRAQWLSGTTVFFGDSVDQSYAKETKWIPGYGLSYDITPEVTAYANLLKSFEASGAVDSSTGKSVAPSTGKSKEVGLKFSLLDDNLTITTAFFDLEQNNLTINDIAGNVVGVQGRKTKGLDFDITGQLIPGWNIAASYTYSNVTDPDTSGISGYSSRVTGQPKHSGSIWSTYELQSGRFQGMGFGLGVQGASNTWNGTTGSYYKMGGWAQMDASLFYHHPKYTVTLGVKNIFDRDLYYYSSSVNYIGVKPGRTARLSVTYSF